MHNISRLNFYVPAALQQSLSFELTPQQKRILTIATVIFGLIAFAYYCGCCFKATISKQKATTPQGGQALQADDNVFKTGDVGQRIITVIGDLKKRKTIETAKCFIKMEFDGGVIKKEFILKQLSNMDAALMQVKKIEDYLNQERANLGACTKGQFVLLFKDSNEHFHQYEYDETKNQNERASGSSSAEDMTLSALAQSYEVVTKQMGFPKEPQYYKGEFIPGSCNVSL